MEHVFIAHSDLLPFQCLAAPLLQILILYVHWLHSQKKTSLAHLRQLKWRSFRKTLNYIFLTGMPNRSLKNLGMQLRVCKVLLK